MIPLTPGDMWSRPWCGIDAWPITEEDVAPFYPVVAASLGITAAMPSVHADDALTKTCFSGLAAMREDFDVRVSTWLPFRSRNFAQEFAALLERDEKVTVWLNASVTSLDAVPDTGQPFLGAVTAKAGSGATLRVAAKYFVLCAGALETTRILLEHDLNSAGSITAAGAPLGRYFADHLSATCGTFRRHASGAFNAAVGPVFRHGLMRTPRLELSFASQSRNRLPSAFAHVTFKTNGDTGFDVVRSYLRRRQGESHPLGFSLRRSGRVVRDVAQMAYWRYGRRRLWIPRQAAVLLQVDIEQVPNAASRLYLADDRDAHGRRRLVVDWRISPEDLAAIRAVTRLATKRWMACGMSAAASLDAADEQSVDDFESLYDVYHPTGTVRMGESRAISVVDRDLRLWASANCYVSSTAIFPSAGSANPGFTHLALTARLARHLSEKLCS
jgi:choline dehydrogenase-like flavoprotein